MDAIRFPIGISLVENLVRFVEIDEKTLRTLSFHDRRYLAGPAVEIFEDTFPQVSELCADPDLKHKDAAYIFHTAFCGSTLLARALDAPGCRLLLKEPEILTDLARHAWQDTDRKYRASVVKTVHRLLSTVAPSNADLVIKAHNGCLNLISEILLATEAQPNSAILLFSPLEDFLASVLPDEPRRQWVRRQLTQFHRSGPPNNVAISGLTDGQSAALLWASHLDDHRRAINSGFHVPVLRSTHFYGDPSSGLLQVSRSLGLGMSPSECDAIAQSTIFAHHSKTGGPYTNSERETDFQRSRQSCQADIDAAVVWLQSDKELRELYEWPPRNLSLLG